MANKTRKSPRKAPAKKSAAKPARKSPANAPRNRRRLLAWIAAGAMALVVALVIVAVVIFIRRPDTPPTAEPPVAGVPAHRLGAARPHKPRPASQDASCPDVQLVSVPGTWESSPTDDPLNPTQFPMALLLNVTRPIAEQFDADRVQTYTVPYTAQFHNPLSADKQMTYNDSRAEGTRATVKAMTDMNDRCPLTSYVLVGLLAGRGDRRRHRQRHRQRARAGRRGPGAGCDVDRRRPPPERGGHGRRRRLRRVRAPRSPCTRCRCCPGWG